MSHKIVNLVTSFLLIGLSHSLFAQPLCLEFFTSYHKEYSKPHIYVPSEIVHKELQDLHDQAADILKIMPPRYETLLKENPSLNALEVYSLIVSKVNTMAQKLKELSEKIPENHSSSVFKDIFLATHKNLFIHEKDELKIKAYLSDRFGPKSLSRRSPEQLNFLNEDLDFILHSALYSKKGYLAEYMTSFYVPSVNSTGLFVKQIISPEMKFILENSFKNEEVDYLLSLEIDIVYNNNSSWGEVKNSFSPYNDSKFESILKRASRVQRMLNAFKRQGINIQFHFFFYTGGLHLEQKEQLEKLGIVVE